MPATRVVRLVVVEKRRPLRHQDDDHSLGPLMMLAVTAAASS